MKTSQHEALDLVQRVIELETQLDAKESELEDLTPGGSEFHNNPVHCLQWVKDRLANTAKIAKERNEVRDKNSVMRDAIADEELLDRHRKALRLACDIPQNSFNCPPNSGPECPPEYSETDDLSQCPDCWADYYLNKASVTHEDDLGDI